MAKRETVDLDSTFDFGFTFGETSDEISQKVKQETNTEVEDLKRRLTELHRAILPFLDNLSKNPDKPIVWPNRVEKIKEFKEKLKKIVEG